MSTCLPLPRTPDDKPLTMVGCGILHKEVDFLIRKNGWNVETQFLASSLHNYFDRLYQTLDSALEFDDQKGRDTIVFYGACHPKIDDILGKHHTLRTQGQNCIVMLLGYEKFMDELGKGAYFLLEDWALSWEPMITECFGNNLAVIREIFHGSHKKIIAIRTPCSTDFTRAAEAAAAFIDLPLEWMDADLTQLEAVLVAAIAQKQHTAP
jgi:hypothetical protein